VIPGFTNLNAPALLVINLKPFVNTILKNGIVLIVLTPFFLDLIPLKIILNLTKPLVFPLGLDSMMNLNLSYLT